MIQEEEYEPESDEPWNDEDEFGFNLVNGEN